MSDVTVTITEVVDAVSAVSVPVVVTVDTGKGADGTNGTDGVGVPEGGTTAQVLAKASNTDFDTEWVDQTGGGGGGAVASVNGQTGVVVLDAADVGAATTAQGALADTAVQPGDLGTAAAADTGDFDPAGAAASAQAAAIAASQPLDSDLTAIAALTTTSFGRAVLALADAAALRTAAGLGDVATHAAADFDAAGAAAAAQAASQPLDSDLTAIAALTTTSFGRALLATADAAAARTAIGAGTSSFDGAYSSLSGKPTLGTAAAAATGDFDAAGAAAAAQAASQPLDSDLTAIAALTTTTYGRAFLALANQAALMTLLSASSTTASGIVELATTAETQTGTDAVRAVTPAGGAATYQPLDSDLTTLAGLTATTDNFLQAKSSAWASRTPAQVAADLALPVAAVGRSINTQTGTSYTLVLSDGGKFVTMNNASASTLTVPPNSSVAFPTGTFVEGVQLGAGQVTLTAGAGVTIRNTPGLKIAAQYGTFGLLKIGTDEWVAMGRLSA